MASSASSRSASLHPSDWLTAAYRRFSNQGVESVRVEALARDLRVSKGSFYWHFHGRGELLDRMLSRWESDELAWIEAEDAATPAARWAQIVAKTAGPRRIRSEVALRGWARRDPRVALRVAVIERKKAALIASVLREVGFAPAAAEGWAEIVLMVCLGWLDRATRDRGFEAASRGLGEFLSDVLLAASSGGSALHS
ncbi:MAG: TetR/AcrR family transcriptional regulator [Acidobacteriota bacterium]|nr:TetR/AcrR family transcriptional regulator [Acidobacteriota bacterium]